MDGYVNSLGSYYEGDPQPGFTKVPQRPSQFHNWSGSTWVLDLSSLRLNLSLQLRDYISTTKRRLLDSQHLSDESILVDSGSEANDSKLDPNFQTYSVPTSQTTYPLVTAWALGKNETFQNAANELSQFFTIWKGAVAAIQAAYLQGTSAISVCSDLDSGNQALNAGKQAMDSVSVG